MSRYLHVPLGILPGNQLEIDFVDVGLEEGDRIIFFTDGITESFNGNEEAYGDDRLINSLCKHVNVSNFAKAILQI